MESKFVIILCIASLTVIGGTNDGGPKVCIDDGCLIGFEDTSRLNRTFSSFLGIPYAKPPIGELRFKPPENPEPWDTREAKKDGNMCIAAMYFRNEDDPPGSEDCLYLNVYTPVLPEIGVSSPDLPVMVFFHPGGFMFWSGTTYHFQPHFFMDRGVILVTLNYRLNILGFLSTEDEVAPGNWGLKDQVHALQWVNDNIGAFGGDPDKVTIFGGSAGGASVHYHMLSPLSRGLFTKAIAQSGLANARWAYSLKNEAREHAEYIGQHFNCPTENSTVLVDCLRKKPAEELIEADPIFFVWSIDPLIKFPPVVEPDIEGAFLMEMPNDLLNSGKFADVPFMAGIMSKEGVLRSGAIMSHDNILQNYDVLKLKSFSNSLHFYQHPVEDVIKIIDKINKYYFKGKRLTLKQENNMIHMFSDRYFVHPLVKAVEMQRKHQKSPIYLYSFEYEGPKSFATVFGRELSTPLNGTAHLDDYLYLFPMEKTFFKNDPWTRSSEEDEMIERMLDILTNFAIFGNPAPSFSGFTWNPVKSEDHEYLVIKGPHDLKMSLKLRSDAVAFWDKLDVDSVKSIIHDEL
ncbi:venom carboxylesterase-6 [Cephus cinctus]|uniref:Carboxylic ester hydrolase n=1 Tax=Cephus cinctus TaxID=211228 RepID=A0AAJ7C0E5_CEPCN|nr:venom carboxylesterase-6 [Cephus cinctus]